MSESTVFVVRVWRAVEPFRACARAVDHDAVEVFTTPDALLRFLQRDASEPTVPAAPARPGRPESVKPRL